jgi:hypothetical protein
VTFDPESLVGTWITDPSDASGMREYGLVTMEFRPDGTLVYTSHAEETDQIMLLTYRVEADVLLTDQPSAPREERTPCRLEGDTLYLAFGGVEARYVRA